MFKTINEYEKCLRAARADCFALRLGQAIVNNLDGHGATFNLTDGTLIFNGSEISDFFYWTDEHLVLAEFLKLLPTTTED